MVTAVQSIRSLSTIEFIRLNSYFAGLNDDVLESISRLMVERTVEKNEIIYLEQGHAKAVYFVVSGQIKLFKMSVEGREQIVRLGRPGDCFGHTGIFNGSINPESVQAAVPSVLYGLMNSDLETLLWEHQQLALNTIKVLATEMHHYITLVEDLSLRRVSGRLARMLLEYSSEGVFDESLILTRGDMAAMTGTVREVIGKSLKALEGKGVIISNSRHIIIRDSDALRIMAGLA